MILRTTLRYWVLFALLLTLLSAGAYEFLAREYTALLGPALGTPEGISANAAAMRRVALTIAAFDAPLLLVVGVVSWLLARASLAPLLAAQERERAFAADAAHALRSPLATIAALAQTHARTCAEDEALAFERIAAASLEASALVGDLLTLARSAGEAALVREPVDLGAIVKSVAAEFAPRAEEAGLDFRCDPSSAVVDADERRLRELARNLLENALRHARRKAGVEVRATAGDAELLVWNDGEAVGPERKEKIFERFYTADGAGGSGLGLAIVSWIARAHGGSVAVRDARGGAEFVVRLPLRTH